MALDAPPDVPRLASFTVGDWLIEPKACRVSRGGTVVKLRPQLVDLLICLARRAGEIVLRDEILAEVWPGQYVAESGLSRCVAELRQILKDDAQEPRFIETFPKRGYRLVAPVVWQETAGRADAGADADPPVPVTLTPETPVQAVPEPATSLGDEAPGEPDAASVDERGKGGAAGFRRRGVFAAAALGLLASVAVAVVVLTRTPASALTERDTVLLADVRNSTDDVVFDDALRLALAVNLEQAPFLRILPRDVVRAASLRAGRRADEPVIGPLALDVCRREGAAVVLGGSIAPLGRRYAVGIEAVACATGEEIGRALEQAENKEAVLEALERAATRIRRDLGESRESLQRHNAPLVRATTPSLEALRALSLGDHHRDHARIDEALALYRQATELDPDFALAWARLAAAAALVGRADEAIPALRRAYELRERASAPERFYIAAHYYRVVEADPEKAIETYRAWQQMYPGSAVPPTNLASILTSWMGEYDAALPYAREGVRLAPYSSLAASNLVFACLGAGRMAEARTALAEAVSRSQDDSLTHQSQLMLALASDDRAALEREIRWATGVPGRELIGLRLRASAAMANGRLREGRALWADAVAKARGIGPAALVAQVHLDQAEAEALVGDVREARAAAAAGLAADRRTAALLSSALVQALAGDTDPAKASFGEALRQGIPDAVLQRVWVPVVLALNTAGEGRAGEAIAILLPVGRFERGRAFGLIPLGVRAIIARMAGRSADAVAAFEALVRLRAVVPGSAWVPFARLGLARALRESGDTARSVAAYDDFLASWGDADPDAPLLGAVRRERDAVARR